MSDTFDYRDLLARYMDHVGTHEGTVFLSGPRPDYFTEAEWLELRKVAGYAPNE